VGQVLLGWRDVPVDSSGLGESVKPTEPVIRLVLVGRGPTTAAGDAFAAGYLCQRLASVDPAGAAAYGNRLAARVIQYRGAINGVSAMQEFMPFSLQCA
jgi:glutamate synthase domain-containing protein 1